MTHAPTTRSAARRRTCSRHPQVARRTGAELLERRVLFATHVWTGVASGLWSNAANWTGGSPAGDPQAVLSFPAPASGANLSTTNDLAGLTVASIDLSAGGYALGGGGGGNAITLVRGPQGDPRVHFDAGLAATLDATIALDLVRSDPAIGLTFDVAAGSTLTVSGVVSGGAADTTVAKEGAGKLIFSGANTFADAVRIDAGVLNARNGTALGTTAAGANNRTAINGGTLEIEGSLFLTEAITEGAAGGTLRNVSGNSRWSGDVFLASTDLAVDLAVNSSLTISGKISDEPAGPMLGLAKSGFGTLNLTNANTYRGTTTINGGVLNINNPQALGTTDNGAAVHGGALELQGNITVASEPLELDGVLRTRSGSNVWRGSVTLSGPLSSLDALTGSLTVDGVISGTADLNIVDDAPAKVILTQANTYTGATNIQAASILNIRNALALGEPGGPTVSIGDAGALELELQGANSINENLSLIGNGVNGTGVLRNVGGSNNWTGNALLNFSNSTIGVSGGDLTISGEISQPPNDVEIQFPQGITKVGGGALSLNASNTYSAFTNVNAGTLYVNGEVRNRIFLKGGRLGGTGNVNSVDASAGVLNPGVGIGQLQSVARFDPRGVQLGPGATFEVDINGTIAGTDYDQLSTNAPVNLIGSTLNVHLNFTPPLTGTSFTIIRSVAPVIGTFSGLPGGATISTPRGKLRIIYNGGEGHDVVLTPVVTINTNLNTSPTLLTFSRFPDRSVTAEVDEGGVATLTGTISDPDPGDRFFLDVDWGDATKVQHFKFPPGSDGKPVSLTHRYLDDDPTGTADDAYTIHLAWHDKSGQGNSADLSTVVRNAAPVVSAVTAPKLKKGSLNQAVTFTDPGRDAWTALVDYGDGSGPQTIDLRGKTKLKLKHRFGQPGTYTVTVTVTDDDGGVGASTFDLTW